MGYEFSFVLFGLPKTTNSINRAHWAVKAKEAQRWRQAVCAATCGQRPTAPLAKARLVLTRHSATQPDPDGLCSTFKHVIDGLIDAKVIENDKYINIGMPHYRWEKSPRGKGFIKIEVKEIEEPC